MHHLTANDMLIHKLCAQCTELQENRDITITVNTVKLNSMVLNKCCNSQHYASWGISYGPVSVCLSVSHKSVFYWSGWTIELVFGVEASFDQSYTVFWGNSHIYKNKGTSLWNFFLNSRLRKFRNGMSIERAINLRARERGRCSEHDKLDHRWSADNTTKLWCSTTVVSRRDPQALSTARVCHVGN